jgi:hypothetical protein
MSWTFYGDFQKQTLVRIVTMLQADTYLQSLIGNPARLYPRHIDLITDPTYPLVTITRQGMGSDPGIPQIDDAFLIVDVYSHLGPNELWAVYASRDMTTNRPCGLRSLLSCGIPGSPVGFDFPESTVGLCREVWVADDLYDMRARAYKLSARFDIKYAAKPIAFT